MSCSTRNQPIPPDLHNKTMLLRAIHKLMIEYNKGEMTIYDVVDNLYIMFRGMK